MPPGGLNAFYWYQIFVLDSAVVEVQEMFSSHGGHLTVIGFKNQECRLSHDIQVISNPYITFYYLFELITKMRVSNNSPTNFFLAVPWGCLRFVIVVFHDHSYQFDQII